MIIVSIPHFFTDVICDFPLLFFSDAAFIDHKMQTLYRIADTPNFVDDTFLHRLMPHQDGSKT